MAWAILGPHVSTAAIFTPSRSRGLHSTDWPPPNLLAGNERGGNRLDGFYPTQDINHCEGNEGDEGDDADEGNERVEANEGNGGDVGGVLSELEATMITAVACTSEAAADSFPAMEDAHAEVVATIFTEFCRDDVDDVVAASVAAAAANAAHAFARAVASTQAACVSTGKDFSCASASALAEAWASATAEAHATAVAASAEECACLSTYQALSVGSAATFVTLAADAFARAEVTACSEGDTTSFAAAYSSCAATAYATVWTKAIAEAFLEGDCFSTEVATRVLAETSGDFGVIEGCKRDEILFGDSIGSISGSISGSTAEGVSLLLLSTV